MRDNILIDAVRSKYPKYMDCPHAHRFKSKEMEVSADRIVWLIVERCRRCDLPLKSYYTE